MACVYILKCRDGSLYVGSARNLEQRLAQHAAGSVDSYTASRRPIRLVWFQEFDDIGEAWALEGQIKGWRRAKRLALIDGRYGDLPALSRSGRHVSDC
jgi:putative endonuclease